MAFRAYQSLYPLITKGLAEGKVPQRLYKQIVQQERFHKLTLRTFYIYVREVQAAQTKKSLSILASSKHMHGEEKQKVRQQALEFANAIISAEQEPCIGSVMSLPCHYFTETRAWHRRLKHIKGRNAQYYMFEKSHKRFITVAKSATNQKHVTVVFGDILKTYDIVPSKTVLSFDFDFMSSPQNAWTLTEIIKEKAHPQAFTVFYNTAAARCVSLDTALAYHKTFAALVATQAAKNKKFEIEHFKYTDTFPMLATMMVAH